MGFAIRNCIASVMKQQNQLMIFLAGEPLNTKEQKKIPDFNVVFVPIKTSLTELCLNPEQITAS